MDERSTEAFQELLRALRPMHGQASPESLVQIDYSQYSHRAATVRRSKLLTDERRDPLSWWSRTLWTLRILLAAQSWDKPNMCALLPW